MATRQRTELLFLIVVAAAADAAVYLPDVFYATHQKSTFRQPVLCGRVKSKNWLTYRSRVRNISTRSNRNALDIGYRIINDLSG